SDGHALVFVRVQAANHAGRRNQGNFVFARAPAKEHGNSQSFFFWGHRSFLFRWTGWAVFGFNVSYKGKRHKRGKGVRRALPKQQPVRWGGFFFSANSVFSVSFALFRSSRNKLDVCDVLRMRAVLAAPRKEAPL